MPAALHILIIANVALVLWMLAFGFSMCLYGGPRDLHP